MRCSCSSVSSRNSGSRKKYSTMSRRSVIWRWFFSGKTSQRRSMRPPIGVTVWSTTLRSDVPSSCRVCTSSRLLMVNLSSRTYFSSSNRAIEVMCEMWVCWVISRYCSIAPAATMPLFRWSIPNPFRFFTSKWVVSLPMADCSVNTQSSSSYVKYFCPNNSSKSFFFTLSTSISLGSRFVRSFST